VIASALFETQSRIATALLAHNPSAAEQAAQGMRTLAISDPVLHAAVDNYALAIMAISVRERQISDIDKEVLGAEGRLIQRVTELLREVSARRGHVLSRDFARTLTEAKWQSIVLGTAGVLIGCSRRCWWFAAPCGAGLDRELDPRGRRRREKRLDPGDRRRQRDRPISRARPRCSARPCSMRTRRAKPRCGRSPSSASPRRAIASCSKPRWMEIYVTTPGGALLNANPALARMMGYATPQDLIDGISHIADTIYVHPAARAEYQSLMERDGMVREFEIPGAHPATARCSGSRQCHGGAQRQKRGESATRALSATSPTSGAPRTPSPKDAACCRW